MNDLDMLLDYVIEECSVGQIGGMISHSNDYKYYYEKIESKFRALEIIKSLFKDGEDIIKLAYYAYKLKRISQREYELLKEVIESV